MRSTPASPISFSLFLLSAATLLFEINLTRLFSVAQFYHFAFMIVSLALLGFGASGTFLTLFPESRRHDPKRALGYLCLGAGWATLGAYLLTNHLPFDSFSLAWDHRQVFILGLHYLALSVPFFCSGFAVSLLLAADPGHAGQTYAANLAGSAGGCALALLVPVLIGGEGVVTLSCALAGLAALPCLLPSRQPKWRFSLVMGVNLALLALALTDVGLRLDDQRGFALLELRLSPYKGLSYALQAPASQLIYHRWDASARLDVVRSPSIHSLPGLSYRYLEPLPAQDGLLVDGDDLSALLAPETNLDFASYLPAAAAFSLHPEANALVLEPRGGLDVFTALALGARHVTAVETNPLVVAAAGESYRQPDVEVVVESGRSFLRRSTQTYDVIVLCLAASYHPVRSGAYSLAEDYRYTQEAFQDALSHLSNEGVLSVTRWLQESPSESLRAFALAVAALEETGLDPRPRLFALRGYNTATLLVKITPFSSSELQSLRQFAAERAYDLVYAPDLEPSEINRYNVLVEPVYAQAFADLLAAQPRSNFYAAYPYDVRPPTDDHPFFGHYFKWSQARQVLAELGRTWQPFGGAGYFVILALLGLALVAAAALILLPLALRGGQPAGAVQRTVLLRPLVYFGLIGLAYLLVEIPLLQRFILYLGHPAYALTAVLFSLLLFSALGSQLSRHLPPRLALLALVILLAFSPRLLPIFFSLTLGLPLITRIVLTVLLLAPLGFLMGTPFPNGLRRLDNPSQIPWVWSVNGAASVIASVLAALLALSFGFSWVFWMGALCYLGAWLTVQGAPCSVSGSPEHSQFPLR